MVERKVSKELYLIAFVITAGVFLLGLLLGVVIEEKRAGYVEEQYQEHKIIFSSSQLQYEFLSMIDDKDECPGVYSALYSNLEDLEETRIRLEKFSNKATIEKDEFELLEREYLLSEIRYWMLAKKTKEMCDYDVVTLLYFYSNDEECADCTEQSFVLTYLKKLFGDKLLIFSFNSEITEEPMIGILKTAYGLESYPALVIDDDLFTGYQSNDDLMDLICSTLTDAPEQCYEEE